MPGCRWASGCSKKIEQIVREEMDRAGAIEILMPTLQLADLWRETGRYDAYGPEMLRITDRHERELLYGPTNEEMITEIFRAVHAVLQGAADQPLPHPVEVPGRGRPRFGVMRGREFLMKDAYSFDLDKDGGTPVLQPDVRRLSARLLAHGAEDDPDAGRDRSDRRRPVARVHRPGRNRRKRRVLPTRACWICRSRRATSIIDSDLEPIVDQRTSLYAATEDVHDAARFEARGA